MVSSPQGDGTASIPVGIRAVTRRLNSTLGATLVAALAGANDATAADASVMVGGAQPNLRAVERLRRAYALWQKVSDAEGDDAARAWFISANPWLENDIPVNAIRHDHFRQVAAAARALVDSSSGG